MSVTQVYKTVTVEPADWHAIKMSVWKHAQLARDHAVMAGERGPERPYWELEAAKADALYQRLQAL